jgi:hypothetical protein
MKNNKELTAVKLYTEEEVVRAIELSFGHSTDEVLAGLTPIEIPSDEEIDKANGYAYYGKPDGGKYIAFNEGAKWMRNKIQGGKK